MVTSQTAPEVSTEALLELVQELVRELHPRRKHGDGRPTLDASLEKDLGLDSLGRAELIIRLERAFGLSLPDQLLASAETPRDLLRSLKIAGPRQKGPAVAGEDALESAGDADAAPHSAPSLLAALDWHVQRHPERRHIAYDAGDGTVEELTYADLQRRARAVATGLVDQGLEPGGAVGIMLPTELDYFAAFLGVQLAGGIPVPLYPPVRRSQIEDHLRRQAGILRTALVEVLITFAEVRPLARLLRAQVPSLDRVVTVGQLEQEPPATHLPTVTADDIAFLQFTSGSTGDPKGVVLTHANLLANLRAAGRALDLSSADRVVSWLPLYHDMGLIGAWMGSLYFAMSLSLMSPLTFLVRPASWLWAIHRHRGTTTAAPNFAFELCLEKVDDDEIEGLDLSSWRLALNGAESVSPETVRRFIERFSACGFRAGALLPVYGLAECSVALAFPPTGRGPLVDHVVREPFQRAGRAEPAAEEDETSLRFVSCGLPLAGHEIRVVDATGREARERREGRIQFRGPSATSGYYRNPGATRRLFRGDWLDSGDLGYLAGGELYVTGRAKDVIIRAGRNIYPHEVEEMVGGLDGVRKGCVAVFASADSRSGTERMVLMAETREEEAEELEALRDRIAAAALDLTGVPVDEVVLVPPRTVPKTSSGKIRRAASRELYERGKTGSKSSALWWQITRLAWSGLRPQLARTRRATGETLYAGYVWLVVGLAATPAWLGVVALPTLGLRRRYARAMARFLARAMGVPLEVAGLDLLAAGTPAVLATNHSSYGDAFALVGALPPNVAYVVKSELRRNPFAYLLLSRLGALFVERFDAEKGVEDTRQALAAVERGESLVVFPEGTLQRAPGLMPFKMGAFVVAAEAGVPVVPMALRGTRSILRGGEWFPRRGAVKVTICPAIAPRGSDWSAALELREQVREQVLRHCGEPDLAG
ncbi:MAG: AMP-binding protein [Thermoanaerobaculia bacterium]